MMLGLKKSACNQLKPVQKCFHNRFPFAKNLGNYFRFIELVMKIHFNVLLTASNRLGQDS